LVTNLGFEAGLGTPLAFQSAGFSPGLAQGLGLAPIFMLRMRIEQKNGIFMENYFCLPMGLPAE
jgi:hypothetical protein